MKVLYLCADLGIPVLGGTGASVHVRSLVTALRAAGHSVVLAAASLTKSPWEQPAELDATIWHVPPTTDVVAPILTLKAFNQSIGFTNSVPGELRRILYNAELGKSLKHRLESSPPDIIYERASRYGTAGASLAAALNRPLIVELNAPLSLEQARYRDGTFSEWSAAAERATLTRADAVVVVSSVLREYVIAQGVAPERVHVMPNGVNIERFRPGARDPGVRSTWNLNGGPLLGFVGGLRPWHGVEALPDLLARLVPSHPDLRLIIVGAGPGRTQLEESLRERGLGSHVVFTGPLPHEQVGLLMQQFDIALAPYPAPDHMFYFSPLKLFEYMASGVAVVVPDLGQIAEIVRDGETGLLYRAGDLEALSRQCERLIDDPALRARLGRAAAGEVRTRFTWDRTAARVTDLAAALVSAQEAHR